MSPLGTWLSWARDFALAGALVSATLAGMVLAAYASAEGQLPGDPWPGVGLAMATGSGLGLGFGLLAWWTASSLWHTPWLALAIGPVLGACWAWTALVAIWGRHDWAFALGSGAFWATLPWAAYLAVRRRGRPGWPVMLTLPLWVFCGFLLDLAATWLRDLLVGS